MSQEINRQIDATSAVVQALYWTVVVMKAELYTPLLTYGDELLIKRMSVRIQATHMSFLGLLLEVFQAQATGRRPRTD